MEAQAIDRDAWELTTEVRRVMADPADGYGSGVASLAMVAGLAYAEARQLFIDVGLGIRRSSRPAFSTNSGELRMAISAAGLVVQSKRWRSWDDFHGLGILKVKDDCFGYPGRWHWVVAFRHPVLGIAIFDPYAEFPSFTQMPLDVLCTSFEIYEPKGEWHQVEQRLRLSI